MKVYFIENENPSRNSSGGIMSYLLSLSRFLIKKEHKTTLIGIGKSPKNLNGFSNFVSISNKEECSSFHYLFSLIFRLRKIRFEENSIVHAQRPDMFFPLIFKRKRFKTVITMHGRHDFSIRDQKSKFHLLLYRLMQRKSLKKTDKIIAVSQETKDHYSKKYPFIKNKTVVIPTGINFDKFTIEFDDKSIRQKYNFKESDKIVLYLGRLEKEKNLGFMLESFKKIKKEIPDAKLVYVGKGRELDYLKKVIIDNKLKDVSFLGEIDNNLVPHILHAANVLGLCSLYEGSPIAIKEALASNTPVVSVKIGDAEEVLSDAKGSYIAKNNVIDFAEKVIQVLRDSGNFNYDKVIKKYDAQFIAEQTLNIYQSLLSND